MRYIYCVFIFLLFFTSAVAQSYTQRLNPEAQASEEEVCPNEEVEISVVYTLPSNRSILLNGINELINFGASPAFDFGTNDFSVEFYMKTSTAIPAPAVLVSKADAASAGFAIGYTGGFVTVAFTDGTNNIVGNGFEPVGDGLWHHVAVVVNRGAALATIYVDGFFDNSANLTGLGSLNTTELLRVGAVSTGGTLSAFYNGYIDELRVWNKALTVAEINSRRTIHFNPASVTNLVGYWDFNELSSTTLVDCSPTGSNGVIVNSGSLTADAPALSFSFLPVWNTGQSGTTIFVNPTDTITYSVEIGYCKYLSIDSVTVYVVECEEVKDPDPAYVWVPNAFTPNGDLKNDLFVVQAANISYYEIQIFNRLGNIIYHSRNILNSWDGTFQDDFVQEGVYTYSIIYRDLKNEEFKKQGYVSVMR
jgi:gliding motility-associated-like protein